MKRRNEQPPIVSSPCPTHWVFIIGGYLVIESKCIVPEGTWKEAITLMQLIRRLTESPSPYLRPSKRPNTTARNNNFPQPRFAREPGKSRRGNEREFDLFHARFPTTEFFFLFLLRSSSNNYERKEKGVGR